jgi:hypothetical protein
VARPLTNCAGADSTIVLIAGYQRQAALQSNASGDRSGRRLRRVRRRQRG